MWSYIEMEVEVLSLKLEHEGWGRLAHGRIWLSGFDLCFSPKTDVLRIS